jgi:hypothetical protein
MVCGTVLGNWLGKHALNRIPEKLFRQIFRVLLTLLAIRLLVGAATELGWLDGIFSTESLLNGQVSLHFSDDEFR